MTPSERQNAIIRKAEVAADECFYPPGSQDRKKFIIGYLAAWVESLEWESTLPMADETTPAMLKRQAD